MSAIMPALSPVRTSREQIEQFLALKRIAFVGVSRNPSDFTRTLFKEFRARGYDVVPVNPAAAEIDGLRCYSNVGSVHPIASGALLVTSHEMTDRVVEDCIGAGVRRIWMYRASGCGAVSVNAVEVCRERGIDVIAGECPFMFFPATGFPHRVHGFIRKILGSYPV